MANRKSRVAFEYGSRTSAKRPASLARFRKSLVEKFGARLRELVLFGSYARGEASEDRDVDVLVVIDGLTDRERYEVYNLAYDADAADREHWTGLSPLVRSSTQVQELRKREVLIMSDIDREGVRL